MKNSILSSIVLAALIFSPVSFAKERDNKGPRRGPPAEAFKACDSSSEGASCSFSSRRKKTLNGSCAVPRGERLVCVPEGHKRGKKNKAQAEQ